MIVKKILIIRFSSIGDIILTSPVIRCLKKQIPNVEIHYLTKKQFSILLESNPYLNKVWVLDDDIYITMDNLKAEKFDLVIDLHNNLRTFFIKWHIEKPVFSINKLNIRKWLLVNFKINLLPDKHIVQRYIETIKKIGIINDNEGLDYFIPPNDEVVATELPLTHLHGYVSFAIGAQHATKKLPFEKLKELCEKVLLPIIIIGGKEDFKIGNELEKLFPYKVFNGCGKYNLNQSASIIKQSKLIITHDTSLMHIASAFKKKIHSVWGSTIPAFGMTPYFGSKIKYSELYRTNSIFHEVKNLNCRPCSKIGFQKCPKGHFNCMMNQDFKYLISDLPKSEK